MFFLGCGYEEFIPESFDYKMGEWIRINFANYAGNGGEKSDKAYNN